MKANTEKKVTPKSQDSTESLSEIRLEAEELEMPFLRGLETLPYDEASPLHRVNVFSKCHMRKFCSNCLLQVTIDELNKISTFDIYLFT